MRACIGGARACVCTRSHACMRACTRMYPVEMCSIARQFLATPVINAVVASNLRDLNLNRKW